MITTTDIVLGLVTLCTSTLTAIIGLGGGMVLIGILPDFLPPIALIPVHGAVQLSSNVSRFLFSIRSIRWSFIPAFIVGSSFGIFVFGFFVYSVPTRYIPISIGCFIIINVWVSGFKKFIGKFENYYILGFLQSGLGLIVGATGPLSAAQLRKDLTDKDEIVSTAAVFMTISHLSKLVVFGLIGFQFANYLLTMVAMICGAITGSWIGTQLRGKIPDKWFATILKLGLTALAIKIIIFNLI